MVVAINVESTVHVPEDSVLLINYNITEAGVWDIFQLLTAYRNSEEDFWTIMFPDTGDSRNTDFPITVQAGSTFRGVFVWNYADIRGIGQGNFSELIPYYIQLTIFKPAPPAGAEEPVVASTEPPVKVRPEDPPDPPIIRTPVVGPKVPPAGHFGGGGGVRGGFPGTPDPFWIPGGGGNGGGGNGGDARDPVRDPANSVVITSTGDPTGSTGNPSGRWYDPPVADSSSLIKPFEPYEPTPRDRPIGFGYVLPGAIRRPPLSENPYVTTYIPGLFPQMPRGDSIPGDVVGGGDSVSIGTEEPSTHNSPGRPFPDTVPGIVSVDPYVSSSSSHPRPIIKPVADVAAQLFDQRPQTNIRRPDTTVAGESSRIDSFQVSLGKHIAITEQFSLGENGVSTSKSIQHNLSNSVYGTSEGHQVKYNFSLKSTAGVQYDSNVLHFNPSNILANFSILLEVPNPDIPIGEKLYVGTMCSASSQSEVMARLELWAIDNQNRSILLKTSEEKLVAFGNHVSIDTIVGTHNFVLGPITLVSCLRDTLGKIVQIISKTINIRPSLLVTSTNSDLRVREAKNIISSSRLPSIVADFINIKDEPITIYTKNNKDVFIILEKTASSDGQLGLVLVGSNNFSAASYSLDVYSEILTEVTMPLLPGILESLYSEDIPNVIPVGQDSGTRRLIAKSNSRLILDGKQLYPESHLAGIPLTTTDVNSEVLVHIRPNSYTTESDCRELKLYTSSSFYLRPVVVSITKVSQDIYNLAVSYPYVNEDVALLVHGKNKDSIPENYVLLYANSQEDGIATFSNVSLKDGDYYSIIGKYYDQFNPTKNIVYKSKL